MPQKKSSKLPKAMSKAAASKAKKKSPRSKPSESSPVNGYSYDVFGFDPGASWLAGKKSTAEQGADVTASFGTGKIVFVGEKADIASVLKKHADSSRSWELDWLKAEPQTQSPILPLTSESGPMWIIQPKLGLNPKAPMGFPIGPSPYGRARDLIGTAYALCEKFQLANFEVHFEKASQDEKMGGLVGLEVASYRYKKVKALLKPATPTLSIHGVSESDISKAAALGVSVNLARHLVNVPAGELNPLTYATCVEGLFAKSKQISVDVWEWDKLKRENMGLIMAVGQGAKEKPCLVHLRYRPVSKAKAKKPMAFVGKGITFDTGGLDLKNSAGMRLMKKDMGGSAALVGLAYWLDQTNYDQPCDIYLALAENSVSADAFRPGDVFRSRSGQTVEIHNTDAEGRLVLADALNVAVSREGSDAPSLVVNVATLTGAIKVGLGSDLFGLFSNDSKLANGLQSAGYEYGDRGWQMPLFAEYEPMLASGVADFANASASPFGGAITAGLFLQRFVRNVPWAHLDIYAWTDSPKGALVEPGGSGQAVQCLAGYLERK